MPMRHLIATVYVKDPHTHEDLILLPGESPPREIAELVTNPDAWHPEVRGHSEGDGQPIAVGEPDPTDCPPESGPPREAGKAGPKKPPRRTRSSSA